MGLKEFFFKGKKDIKSDSSAKLINLFTPFFSGEDSAKYSSTYMSIADAHARHFSKMQALAYLKDEPAVSKKYITKLLTLRPNPYMNAPTFWETVARNYFTENNAFIFLEWDYTQYKEPLKALWVLDPDDNSLKIKTDEAGNMFVSFTLDGKAKYTSVENLAIISRNVDPSKFFGSTNKAIQQVLKVLKTSYEGVEQAIRTSAFIRFIVTTSTLLNEKVKKEKAEYFAETYLGKDSSGVAYIDQANSVQQVTTNPKIADAELMGIFKKDVYEYLGSNEKITTACFSEDEWQAYYESSLEPLIAKVAAELTYKVYSKEEIDKGNRIYICADRLQTASLKTRVQVAAMYQKLPVYIPNVVSKLLFLPESPSGGKEFSNLNYVQTDQQNKYQVGKEIEENEEEKGGEVSGADE